MSQGKIRRITDIVLRAAGVPEASLKQLEGHQMRMSIDERVDIAAWTEARGAGALAMPQRYSETKLDAQALVRHRAI